MNIVNILSNPDTAVFVFHMLHSIIFFFYFRNIGFGLCSTLSRIGAAIGPQLVFLVSFVFAK